MIRLNLDPERWATVQSAPAYEVSTHGRVRRGVRILSAFRCRSYLRVTLLRPRRRHVYVHRLVAETFIPCPGDPLELQVDHEDQRRGNAHVDNLTWTDHVENYRRRDERRAA